VRQLSVVREVGYEKRHDVRIFLQSVRVCGRAGEVTFKNSEVDELLEKGRRTFDIEERKKAYFRIQEILADELPYVFLYVPDSLPIVSSRFQGIDPAPIGIGYNIEKWYVPRQMQKYTLEK